MQFRSPYDGLNEEVSAQTAFACVGDSRTKQSFKEECDINTIVRRFNLTGALPTDVRAPQYGDYEEVFDFQSAMNAVVHAHETFELMPAATRARFHNDPQEFLDFCSNKDNVEEMIKMGLVVASPRVVAPDSTADKPSSTVST